MKDALGDRMKDYYESRSKLLLPRRTNTILRIDGKAFHTYTKDMEKPFDLGLVEDMNETAIYLCENIQGVKFAYVQSDEISLMLTDYDKLGTQAWYNGNVQKITSVSASFATAKFNQLRNNRKDIDSKEGRLAQFDSRVFTIPMKVEALNYFIWRQQDAVRNSISSVAQSMYSHKELNKKTTDDMQELIFKKGDNWNNYHSHLKRGRLITKEFYDKGGTERSRWIVVGDTPEFSKEDGQVFFNNVIPF